MRLSILLLSLLAPLFAHPAFAQSRSVPVAISSNPELKALRRAMLDGAELSNLNLRRLADAGDGLAAFKFADRLEQGDGKWSDILHYTSIALYTGRDFVTGRLVRGVKTHLDEVAELSPLRKKSIEDALLVATERGNLDAGSALAEFYATGLPFGEKPDKATAILRGFAESGDGQAALQAAMIAIGGDVKQPQDPELAREMLTLAVESADISARAMAGNLLPLLPAPTEGLTQ